MRPRPPMTNRELIKVLRVIHELALFGYGYPPGRKQDPGLVLALGEIAGRAQQAIQDYDFPRKSPGGRDEHAKSA